MKKLLGYCALALALGFTAFLVSLPFCMEPERPLPPGYHAR